MSLWSRVRAALAGVALTSMMALGAVLLSPGVVRDGLAVLTILVGVVTLVLVFLALMHAIAGTTDETSRRAIGTESGASSAPQPTTFRKAA